EANLLTGTYTQQLGELTVTLKMTSTNLSGQQAQWQLNGGPWGDSGATISNLWPGNYTITCSPVSGCVTPADETVAVAGNQSVNIVEPYAQEYQFVTIAGHAGTNGSEDGAGAS